MTDVHPVHETAANKALIRDFYAKACNGRDIKALPALIADDYVEHNAELDNGRAALEAFLEHIFSALPDVSFTVSRLVAEGDLVVAHLLLRRTQADRGTAVADIFRIADGRIVEHWDVMAPVPEETRNDTPVI